MSELGIVDLLQLMSEYEDRDLVVLTWYFSISLGLYSVAHFVGSKLKLFALAYIVFAYVGFLTYISIKSDNIRSLKLAVIDSLETLRTNGAVFDSLTTQQLALAESGNTASAIYGSIAILSVGVVNIGFLIYKYELGRRHRNLRPSEGDT